MGIVKLTRVQFFRVAVVFVAYLAHLAYKNYDVLIVVMPKYYDAYLIRALFPRDKVNSGTTRVPIVSRILPSVINKNDLRELLSPDGTPIFVKGVLNVSQDTILEVMNRGNRGKTMRMLSYANRSTPHFSPSCATLRSRIVQEYSHFAESHLFSNVSDNHSPLYAGFEGITDPEILEEITGLDINQLGDYRLNNLFLANFPEETMTATLHFEPIESVAIQLVGTKTWYLVSPDQLSELKAIPMPTSFNLPLTDDELLSKLKVIHYVKAEPGDILYFGPHWGHAVSTSEGPNVMFTVRYNAVNKIKKGPVNISLKIFLRFLTRNIGGLPQDNTDIYPLLYDDLNGYFGDCGPSGTWLKIYNAVKSARAST